MFANLNKALAAVALCVTGTVWVLSLMPITQSVPGSDKLHHLLAYAGLMVVWRGVIPQAGLRAQLFLAIALAVMGVAVEFAQAVTPHRFFEWKDMAANALGVLIGWAAFNASAALWARRAALAPRGN